MTGFSIDELERDLGQAAKLRLLANAGGQTRYVPSPETAVDSALARELGADVVHWLAARHSGEHITFPSPWGAERENRANRLRAAVLDAGLTNPVRSANHIAKEFGVTERRVREVRRELRSETSEPLPLFKGL